MTKPNLLLLHGALGSGDQLLLIEKELSEYYTTHRVNFEGHGNSRSDKDFSIELFTNNVSDYLADNGIEQTHIFGYSMGGYVALNLARQYPSKVSNIITYGTKFDWNPEGALKETKMLDPVVIEEKVPAYASHLQSVHHEAGWQSVLRKTAEMMLALGNSPTHTSESLKDIQTPVLIGIGDKDHMVSIAESRYAAESLRKGELQMMEGYKHPIDKNDPVGIAKMIRDFIEK